MTFRVVVDWDVCQDHGQCVFSAPDVFRIGAEGRLELLLEVAEESRRDSCEEAADVCPVQAIRIEG
ncbi:ferredoxin [uncultured Friedmanniella sp.]|uniref:ferredoxin n=1 Tax=uncultured Friedmanniella sp. TaxID=335381 RepID=UPI0035CACC52